MTFMRVICWALEVMALCINVLLDEDMVAHVCDFGIAKLLGESESIAQTKTLATIGYMAPGDACSSKYLIKHIL